MCPVSFKPWPSKEYLSFHATKVQHPHLRLFSSRVRTSCVTSNQPVN
jgi:predicted metalloprotease